MFQKIIHFGICLIVFSLPLYLVRFRIGWVPTNLLEVMICLLFIIWLILQIRDKKFQIPNSKFQIPIFIIFLGITMATLFSADLRISAGIWKGWFIIPLLFFVIVMNSVRTKEQVKNIFIALTLSGLGVALIALFYWLTNNLTYDGRWRAFYLSPNHLAMYLSPILVLSFYLYSSLKKNLSKILLFTVDCLLFIVIYLTYSYGAWLGLLAALVFILGARLLKGAWLLKNQRFVFYLVSFILLLVILGFIWQIPSQKFQSFLDFSRSSSNSRLIIWQSALEIIKDHPLVGIGPGMFQKYYLTYQTRFKPYLEWAVPQPHNIFLAFWLQTGLIGLIGFIWLLIIFFGKKILNTKYLILNTFLMAVMIYTLVHGLIDTPYWKNDLSVIFWLLIALKFGLLRPKLTYNSKL